MNNIAFRQAMGQFATGVTVITTLVDNTPHGMTANGFMSISLNPELIAISIGHKASTLEKIKNTKMFGVSILQENQIDVSKRFAGQSHDEQPFEFEYKEKFPVIKDALMCTVCEVVEQYEAGDHTIFLGTPKSVETTNGQPLLFYQGKYSQLEQIKIEEFTE